MTAQNPAIFLQAGSHPAEDVRRFVSSLVGDRPGILGPDDLNVHELATPAMSVEVSTGRAFVPGTEFAYQGLYFVENRGAATLAVTAADATNTRYDLVVARVKDASYSGALSEWALEVVTGTAAATPAEPTVPANALVLARVTVAPGVVSITDANIEDRRLTTLGQYRVSLGGSAIFDSSLRPAGGDYAGQDAYEIDTGKVLRWTGSAWREVDPAATSGALTPQTGYASFGSTYYAPGYHLSPDGLVTLRGMLKRTGASFSATAGQVYNVATLPAAIIPPSTVSCGGAYAGYADPPQAYPVRIHIAAGSANLAFVPMNSGTGTLTINVGYVNLDGVSWYL